MQRHQVPIAGLPDQASQQGLLDEASGRHDGKEMRFVRHQQVCVRMQHACLERQFGFLRNLAEVVDLQVPPIGSAHVQRPAVGVQHAATSKAVAPDF